MKLPLATLTLALGTALALADSAERELPIKQLCCHRSSNGVHCWPCVAPTALSLPPLSPPTATPPTNETCCTRTKDGTVCAPCYSDDWFEDSADLEGENCIQEDEK